MCVLVRSPTLGFCVPASWFLLSQRKRNYLHMQRDNWLYGRDYKRYSYKGYRCSRYLFVAIHFVPIPFVPFIEYIHTYMHTYVPSKFIPKYVRCRWKRKTLPRLASIQWSTGTYLFTYLQKYERHFWGIFYHA